MELRGIVVAAAVLAVCAPAAQADDTYTTYTCRTPNGRPASVQGWSTIGNDMEVHQTCASGGAIEAGPTQAVYGDRQAFAWQFTAPADTRITAWTLWRTVHLSERWNWSLFRDIVKSDSAHLVETCWWGSGCSGLGDGSLGPGSRVSESGDDIGAVIGYIDCNPPACNPWTVADMTFPRADFTLRDLADPAFDGTPSGDLFDTRRPLAGVRTASFSATDRGSGIYQATLYVDGRLAATVPVDTNAGRCVKPFTGAVPCKLSASGSLSFNTASLPDGGHALRLVVTDATGTNSAAYGPIQVRTENRGARCDPAVKPGSSPVLAHLKGTRRSLVTRRSGRATVKGRIVGVGPGAVVELLTRELRTGARARVAAITSTDSRGRFTLRVPKGRSRRLRAAWHVRSTDPLPACSRPLDVLVPARSTLHVNPRVVLAGHRIRISGRLQGGRIPARGKLIDLQAHERGAWRTFATVRTRRNGRFTTHYRFRRAAPRITYPMRVRVRPDAAYPYALGYSRAVRVTVR